MSAISRLSVRHVTDYRYERAVLASYNELRVTPRTGSQQAVLDARVEVSPSGWIRQYVDYFGTVVHALELHAPHSAMEIVGTAVVESGWQLRRSRPELRWDDVVRASVTDRFVEYLAPTTYTAVDSGLAEVAHGLRESCDPAAAPDAVADWVRSQLTYRSGVTGVHSTGLDALQAGQGVCQDFAHISLALLRAMGVPARYVSGYLHPEPDAPVGRTVTGESHAWVQAWVGEWVDVDPTNGRPVESDHVLVATGRDYADVAPVRGVYEGGGRSTMSVVVEITRLL
jgi:transglutaminase-like putative cysteine protease